MNASYDERPPPIETERLWLVVLLPSEIEALIAGNTGAAGRLASVRFPSHWPEDVAAREGLPWHLAGLKSDPLQRSWRIRVRVERQTGEVVGSTSFKGPPDERGEVEIGWGVNHNRRRRGYAFEAVSAALAWAASQSGVRAIIATIPEDNEPSRRLAQKLGMVRTADVRRQLPVWVYAAAASRPASRAIKSSTWSI